MTSARDVNARIADLQNVIAQTLQRCANLPVPDSSRYETISTFRSRLADLVKRASEAYAAIGKNERGALDRAQADLADVQRRQRELDAAARREDIEFQKRLNVLQKELAEAYQAVITAAATGDREKALAH